MPVWDHPEPVAGSPEGTGRVKESEEDEGHHDRLNDQKESGVQGEAFWIGIAVDFWDARGEDAVKDTQSAGEKKKDAKKDPALPKPPNAEWCSPEPGHENETKGAGPDEGPEATQLRGLGWFAGRVRRQIFPRGHACEK